MSCTREIRELLEALRGVCGVGFAVCNADGGREFAAGPELKGSTGAYLVERIRSSGKEQSLRLDGSGWACGLPLGARHMEGAEPAFLLAYNERGAAEPDPSMGNVSRLLGGLSRVIEEESSARREAIEMAEEINRAYEDLSLYSRIAARIQSLRFSTEMLRDLLEEVMDAMRVELACALFTARPLHDVVVARGEFGGDDVRAEAFGRAVAARIDAQAPVFEGNCRIVSDSQSIPAFAALYPRPFRILAVRIEHARNFYGWLILGSSNMKEIFRRGEYRLLSSLAEEIGLVITNSDLYRELETFVIDMVKTLVMAIEAKDRYTRGHSERVSKHALRIAARLNLDEHQKRNLQWSAILHDIGKIGVPEDVLRKPAALTDDEYELIKAHPWKGVEILKPVSQLADALPAILYHHERIDGKGYPAGLSGDKVPFLSRIIAVADTYDALTSQRPYRAVRTPRQAADLLAEVAGSQLDAEIVTAFLDILDLSAAPASSEASSDEAERLAFTG